MGNILRLLARDEPPDNPRVYIDFEGRATTLFGPNNDNIACSNYEKLCTTVLLNGISSVESQKGIVHFRDAENQKGAIAVQSIW